MKAGIWREGARVALLALALTAASAFAQPAGAATASTLPGVSAGVPDTAYAKYAAPCFVKPTGGGGSIVPGNEVPAGNWDSSYSGGSSSSSSGTSTTAPASGSGGGPIAPPATYRGSPYMTRP